MNKDLILIISDPHFGIHENNENFLNYQKESFKWIYSIAEKNNIGTIVLTGDLSHKRKLVSIKVINEITEIIDPKYFWYFIAGNHDIYYKNTNHINFLKVFLENNKNIKCKVIYKEPKEYKLSGVDCLFIPWITKSNYNNTLNKIKKTKAKYIFSHLELVGFELVRGVLSERGQLSLTDLANFDIVWTGHFHIKTIKDNIIYTGSPYELTWNDYGDNKGIFTFNVKTGEFEFHKNPHSLFIKLWIDKGVKLPKNLDEFKNKKIKIFLNIKRTIKIEKFLTNLSNVCDSLDIIDNNIIFDDINEMELGKMDIEDIMEEYIKNMDDISEEDKKNINTLIKKTYEEALTKEE